MAESAPLAGLRRRFPRVVPPRLPGGAGGGSRRVRVPTVLQMEAVECGAAALAMVLGYHGRIVSLEELRVACGVSRDGSKASNLLRAARSYGLETRGFRKEPEALRGLPVPMVVHWNFNHFVVLEGFRRGRAHLNDPSTGPRTVSLEEFDQAFTGVVLTFEPGDEFEPGGRWPSLRRALASRLRGSGSAVAFAVLAGLALVVPGLLGPAFSRIFVDDVLVGGSVDWLVPLLWAMAITAAVAAALTWVQQTHLLRMETRLALGTSARFLWHVLRLPVGFFTQRYAGEIASRVALNDRVAQLLSGQLATTVLSLVMIVFYAAVMAGYDPLLTAIGVVLAALNLAALRALARRRTDLARRLLQDRGKLTGTAMGGLQTIETLKATGGESAFFARWAGYHARAVNTQQALALQTQLLLAVPPFLTTVGTALVLGVGGLRVMDGELSMGMLVAFQALLLAFLAPVGQLVGLGGTLQEVRGDMSRLDDVLDAVPDPRVRVSEPDGPPPAVRPRLDGRLEMRGVRFGYSPLEAPLIDGFDLAVAPGRRVALVGPSGCGKSTLARIVCGLLVPWDGEVLFDGVPRDRVAPDVLRDSLAFVDQEIFLFEGTVRDNLTLWDPTVPEAELVRAAKDACIHEEVTSRPGGYRAHVDEEGRNFSGGQRQRLEVARALAGSPSLLVLDEATSALDPTTEKEIDDGLRRRGCTCLIVAHRLSTIRDCDEIVVLEAGRVVQRGTHDEMAAVAGPYRDLVASR